MTTLRDLAAITSQTLQGWVRWFPLLAAWFLAGWTIRTLTTHLSVLLGGDHRGWATVVFVLGVTCQVLATVGMIWMLKPTLQAPRLLASPDGTSSRVGVPDAVVRREGLTEVLLLAIGPFLAVYAVWNVIDAWVGDLFMWNIAVNPLGMADDSWSVSVGSANLALYAWVGGIAFVLRLIYGLITRHRGGPLVRLPLVFLEGLWAFCLFFITLMGLDQFVRWFFRRAVYVNAMNSWQGFLEWLPDLALPFDLMLPEALREATIWLTETLWPALWQGFCLPLVWVALAATVLGWRDFSLRALQSGRIARRLDALTPRAPWARGFVQVGSLLTADLRDKYYPVLHALSLVWRSGPRILGCLVLLYAVIQAAQYWVHAGVLLAFAPGDQIGFVRLMPLLSMPGELLGATLTPVLLVTVLDRGVLAALRAPQPVRKSQTGHVPPASGRTSAVVT